MSSSFTPSSEGTVDFVVGRETYHTWYSVYGDLTDHSHWRTPLIVVHGGPGLTHDYLLPISDLAHSAHIPVVFYDQLGNGRSTHLRWRPPAFWSIDLFVDELANLVARLGVQDAFDVLGHSWGGRLATEWEVRRQPAGLRRLVLSNTFASVALWERSLAQLRQRLPEKVQEELRWAHGVERHDAALEVFQAKHMCTVSPLPAEFRYSMEQTMDASGDPTVWNAMGRPEMRAWTVVDRLHRVRVPTLVVNGAADTVQDFVCAPFFWRIRQVKWTTFAHSSHMPMWEERDRYMQVVADFLTM